VLQIFHGDGEVQQIPFFSTVCVWPDLQMHVRDQ
jgi:hypothetical protein